MLKHDKDGFAVAKIVVLPTVDMFRSVFYYAARLVGHVVDLMQCAVS